MGSHYGLLGPYYGCSALTSHNMSLIGLYKPAHERVFPVRRISLFLWGARMFFLGLFCAKSSHFGQAKYLLCTKMGLFVQANILLRTKLGRFRQANILLRTKLGLFAQAIFSPHIFVLFFSHFLQFELWWKQILVFIILSDAQFIEYYTYCSPRVTSEYI